MSRLNVAIGADITELEKGWGKAIKLINDGGKEMSADVAKAAKEIQDRLTALASSKPTARVVRQLQTMAIEADKTLSGAVQTLRVVSASPGTITSANIDYLSYQYSVELIG